MYKQEKYTKTSLRVNKSIEGESIEMKIERIVNNKEPITDGAPLIYSERKDGVLPGYNIRTDRWEVALEAMDKVSGDRVAKREARIVEMNKKKDAGSESTQGQDSTSMGGQTAE